MSSDLELPMPLEVPGFIAKKQGLLSVDVLITHVHKETPKSFLVDIISDFSERSACWRCSRTITNPASRRWGVGPDCAAALGLPYDQGAPGDFPHFAEDNPRQMFIPKSLLTESQIAACKVFAQGQDSSEPRKVAKVRVNEDHDLELNAPFVNKKFVDELKWLSGRKWDYSKKVTTFTCDDETLGRMCDILVDWGLLVELDSQCQDMLERRRKLERKSTESLNAIGVTTPAAIKEVDEFDVDGYDWGLKDGVTPWRHQAKAILYAASMFGINVPKRRDQ